MKKGRIVTNLILSEISAVTVPAQEPALAAIIKCLDGAGGAQAKDTAIALAKYAESASAESSEAFKKMGAALSAVIEKGGSVLFPLPMTGGKLALPLNAEVALPKDASADLSAATKSFSFALTEFNEAAAAAARKVEKEHMSEIDTLKAQVAELTAKNTTLVADLAKAQENAAAEIEKARKSAEITKSDEAQVILGVEIKKSVVGAEVFAVMQKQEVERQRIESERTAESIMKCVPGTLAEKSAIVRAIESIKDEPARKSAMDILEKANAAFEQILKSSGGSANAGMDEDDETADAQKKFDDGAAEFAKAHNIENKHQAAAKFMATEAGRKAANAVTKANAIRAKMAR